MSEMADESFQWERQQYMKALATTNERIKELEADAKRLEKSQMDLGEAWAREIRKNNLERSLSDKLENALNELTALVRGECQSLLNEDSGGDGNLSINIDSVLAEVAAIRAKETT